MIVQTTVKLDHEEQDRLQEYIHTYVDRVLDEGVDHYLYSTGVMKLWTSAWMGEPLTRDAWTGLFWWAVDMDEYARENLWGDRNMSYDLLTEVRGMCFEAVRLCKRYEMAKDERLALNA